MFKFGQYRKIMKDIKEQAKERKPVYDQNGSVVVNMVVKDDDYFLSEFSKYETPIISKDVADFLEDSTQSVLPSEKITLNVESNCIDDNEKDLYKKAIKEYYTERYIANQREIKRNWLAVGILTLLGILILTVALFFDSRLSQHLWSEVIDIVAWVLLWEAVDIGFFHSRALRVKRQRYLSFLSMDINYKEIA